MSNEADIHIVRLFCFILFYCLSLLTLSDQSQAQHAHATATLKSDLNRSLFQAVESSDKAKVSALLKQGADINARNKAGRTPLQWAMEFNPYFINYDMLPFLRSRGAVVTGLPEAAALGELATVRALLEKGADVNGKNPRGRTALSFAAERGFTEIVQLLLDHGVDVNLRYAEGWTALMLAAIGVSSEAGNHGAIVRLLRSRGANVDATDLNGRTVLMFAADRWNVEAVKFLLDNGADPNARDKYGYTALMWDVSWVEGDVGYGGREQPHLDIIDILLLRGAQLNAQDNEGRTVLMHAIWAGHSGFAARLMERGADVTLRDHKGRTGMTLAAHHGDKDIIQGLEKRGVQVGVMDALLMYDEPGARALLKGPVDMHAQGPYGETLLMAAAQRGYVEVVRALLQKGANPNEQEDDGLTPLLLALAGRLQQRSTGVSFGPRFTGDPKEPRRLEIVRELVQAGAKINERILFRERTENKLVTPLQWAIEISPTKVIQFLLASGADVNLAAEAGRTPLMTALEDSSDLNRDFNPRHDVTQMLLDRGANVNAEDAKGETALMRCLGDLTMMQKLRRRGADLKHRNHRGQTVLALIAESNEVIPGTDTKESQHVMQTWNWLLAQGMDIHEKDQYGWTLLTYAAMHGDQKRVAKLKHQGFQVGIMDAVFLNDAAKVRELLDKGENPNRPEPDGSWLLIRAVDWGDKNIIRILLQHGANVRLKDRLGITALETAEFNHRDDIKEMLEKAGAE